MQVIHAERKARKMNLTNKQNSERMKSFSLLKHELLQDVPTFTPIPHCKTFK